MKETVRIITPGNCDYFRKVVIPAALGDDTGEAAPKNGAYRNALVEYEENGHIYLYSSDGIPTMLVSDAADVESQIQEILLALATKANTNDLARVAFTGDYSDILNRPTSFSNEEWTGLWA